MKATFKQANPEPLDFGFKRLVIMRDTKAIILTSGINKCEKSFSGVVVSSGSTGFSIGTYGENFYRHSAEEFKGEVTISTDDKAQV